MSTPAVAASRDHSRCRMFPVSNELFLDLFAGHYWYCVQGGLPDDAEILAAYFDCQRNRFIVKVWSASFDPVAPGCEYPWMELPAVSFVRVSDAADLAALATKVLP